MSDYSSCDSCGFSYERMKSFWEDGRDEPKNYCRAYCQHSDCHVFEMIEKERDMWQRRAQLWKRAAKEYRKARNGNRLRIRDMTNHYEEQYFDLKHSMQAALNFERTQSAGLAAHHAHETASLRQDVERLTRTVEDVQNNNAGLREQLQVLLARLENKA